MTYFQLESAKATHQLAAKTIRYAGYKAQCVKNTACEQPYQVNVKCTTEEAKELQLLMCKLLKNDTINIVEA